MLSWGSFPLHAHRVCFSSGPEGNFNSGVNGFGGGGKIFSFGGITFIFGGGGTFFFGSCGVVPGVFGVVVTSFSQPRSVRTSPVGHPDGFSHPLGPITSPPVQVGFSGVPGVGGGGAAGGFSTQPPKIGCLPGGH